MDVIGEVDQRVAGAMFPSEAILMLVQQAVVFKIVHQLRANNSLKELGKT